MKFGIVACSLMCGLYLLAGCSMHKSDSQPERGAIKCSSAHPQERYIGGHLYRNGRHIHHHPECTPPEAAKEKR